MTRWALVRRAAGAAAVALVAASVVTGPTALAQDEGPQFTANVTADQVFGSGFGGPVTVTVAGPGAETHTYTDANGISYANGSFQLFLDPSEQSDPVDVQPGQTVTVTGPNGTKTLLVADLGITSFDFAANTVDGTVDSATGTVTVWADRAGANGWTTAEVATDGTWAADFDAALPPYDLRVLDRARAAFTDADQDSTMVEQTLAPPRFAASVELQEVVGLGWAPGTVTLVVERPGIPDEIRSVETLASGLEYSGNLQSGAGGNVYVDFTTGAFRLQPGDILQMSQGSTYKIQTIPALSAALPEYAADVVTGTTTTPVPDGSFLSVDPDLFDYEVPFVPVTPGTDGLWSADLATVLDVTPASMPAVVQTDVDGDVTESHAPMPMVYVDPAADRIWAPDFAAGAVTLTIRRGGDVVRTATVETVNVLTKGSWNLDMWAQPTATLARPTMVLYDGFDVVAGDQITVSDGVSTRTITVAALTVDSISAATDVVSGTAAPDGAGVVTLHLGNGEGGFWGYAADVSAGAWSYWFLNPDVSFALPPEGLVPGMAGQAMVGTTMVRWTVPSAYAFTGLLKPLVGPPAYNRVKAGASVLIRFGLGGDEGLAVFAADSPASQELVAGVPTGAVTPTTAVRELTYNAKQGVYTYSWSTDRAWSGTSRQLILRFADGSTATAYFTFR